MVDRWVKASGGEYDWLVQLIPLKRCIMFGTIILWLANNNANVLPEITDAYLERSPLQRREKIIQKIVS